MAAPLAQHVMTATEDVEYKGYRLRKGIFVISDIQAHNKMNNALYPKANEFHFARWLSKGHRLHDPNVANTEEIDYNVMSTKFRTFNIGPHMCLGAHFAKQEVRIVVTRLMQSYTLEVRNETLKTFPLKQFLNEFKLVKR
jgi:cytochrome P450